MKAVGLNPGVKDCLQVFDIPSPETEGNQVLVRLVRVGVCGTDLELKAGAYGEAPPGADFLIVGHEALGQVAEVGEYPGNLRIGHYVGSSVRRACPQAHCSPCRQAQNDMCVTWNYVECGIAVGVNRENNETRGSCDRRLNRAGRLEVSSDKSGDFAIKLPFRENSVAPVDVSGLFPGDVTW